MEQKKNKSLIVGIVAAVVVLVALLALVLTQCVGGMWKSEGTTAPAVTQDNPKAWKAEIRQYNRPSKTARWRLRKIQLFPSIKRR